LLTVPFNENIFSLQECTSVEKDPFPQGMTLLIDRALGAPLVAVAFAEAVFHEQAIINHAFGEEHSHA